MDIQVLRNLTTSSLHTSIDDIYEAIEFFTGEKGIMTHQLPNASRALEPILKEKISDQRFWNGEYDPSHVGEYSIDPLNEEERKRFFKAYAALPSPFSGM